MLQPYLESVDTSGESALMYIDGRFSHAIRKGALLPAGAPSTARLLDHAVIGANAVVLNDVPSGATAVGVPARIV